MSFRSSNGSSLSTFGVRNETTVKLLLRGRRAGDELVLAPLEEVGIDALQGYERDALPFLQRRILDVRPIRVRRQTRAFVVETLMGLGAVALLALVAAAVLFDTRGLWIGAGAILVALVVGGFVLNKLRPHWLARTQLLPMLLVFVVVAVVPAVIIYFGTDLDVQMDRVLAGKNNHLTNLAVIARGLQWLLIALLAGLPAGLFFLFDRMKIDVLRERFERDIMVLDPTVTTGADVRARYGNLMSEVFGADAAADVDTDSGAALPAGSTQPRTRFRGATGRTLPIIATATLIMLGWVLALLHPAFDTYVEQKHLIRLVEPQRSPVVFAFLGAYAYSVLSLFRGYTRSDLRPKSYTYAGVRIVISIVFGWTLELLFFGDTIMASTGQSGLLVLAFTVGFLPETFLVWLQERLRVVSRRAWVPQLYDPCPLTELEGIDIYERTRLLEEGVANIEGLAHHRLPELMLQTRIPTGRIVDWTDQAILYIHAMPRAQQPRGKRKRDAESTLDVLRRYGIRTATDLLNAHANAKRARKLGRFYAILEPKGSPATPRLGQIVDAIADEQWIHHLQRWHSARHVRPATLAVTRDGRLVYAHDPALPSRT